MVIFYQNNSEGSFDDSLRELEQLPQRVFCVVTVWDTPLTSIEFHFPQHLPAGKFDPTRVYMSVSVKILFTRILKLLAPTFEYDISMEMAWFYRN